MRGNLFGLRVLPLLVLAIAGVALAGCGDDDDDTPTVEASPTAAATAPEASATATPSPTTAASPTPAGTPTPRTSVSTGVPIVDQFVKALFSKDVKAVLDLVDFQDVECTTNPQGIGGPPICPAGKPTGSIVKAITVSQCEGGYVTDADAAKSLQQAMNRVVGVYSVARIAGGGYRVVAEATPAGQPAVVPGIAFELSAKGLVDVGFGCGTSVRAMSAAEPDYVVAPPPVGPPPAGTPKTGVAQVDAVINAITSLDIVKLSQLTKRSKVGCGFDGTVPRCDEGVSPGTLADAVEIRTCRSFFFSPRGLAGDYDLRLGAAPKITAVAKGTGDISYWVIVNVATAPNQEGSAGRAFGLTAAGQIAVIDGGCSESAPKIAARYTDFLLAPK